MKLMTSTFLLLLVVNVVSAQQGRGGQRGGTPEERAERQTEKMVEQLSLSEAQAAKIKEVNLTFGKKMQEARAEADGNREGMRETMQALRGEQVVEYKKYLTAEQFVKFEKIQAERRGRRGAPGARGERGKRGKQQQEEKIERTKQLEKEGNI